MLSKIADRLIELTNNSYRIHEYGFEKYLDVLREEQAAEKKAADAEKFAKAAEAAKEKQIKSYRSKQQRSADAARKTEMRRIENEIDEFQKQIDVLTEEISREEIYTDYELMNSKCAEIDRLKQLMDDDFEKLIELDEQ